MKRQAVASECDVRTLLRERSRRVNGSTLSHLVPSKHMSWKGISESQNPPDQELLQQIDRLERSAKRAQIDSITALIAAIGARDLYTRQHSINVAAYAEALARRAELSSSEIVAIVIAALLHDVGKIALPDGILKKSGALNRDELAYVAQHPAQGVAILQSIRSLDQELLYVLHHHEWYDGSGYPHGLIGQAIPLGARFVQTADCVDAMLSPRSYKEAMTIDEAMLELQRCRGIQFDPDLADLATDWLRENQCVGSTV